MFTRLFFALGPLLPCCAEQACVRSGSDHPPVLRKEIRHRQLQYKHLEREIVERQRVSMRLFVFDGVLSSYRPLKRILLLTHKAQTMQMRVGLKPLWATLSCTQLKYVSKLKTPRAFSYPEKQKSARLEILIKDSVISFLARLGKKTTTLEIKFAASPA